MWAGDRGQVINTVLKFHPLAMSIYFHYLVIPYQQAIVSKYGDQINICPITPSLAMQGIGWGFEFG